MSVCFGRCLRFHRQSSITSQGKQKPLNSNVRVLTSRTPTCLAHVIARALSSNYYISEAPRAPVSVNVLLAHFKSAIQMEQYERASRLISQIRELKGEHVTQWLTCQLQYHAARKEGEQMLDVFWTQFPQYRAAYTADAVAITIKALAAKKDVQAGLEIFEKVVQPNPKLHRDTCLNAVIELLASSGRNEEALELFHDFSRRYNTRPTPGTFAALIRGYKSDPTAENVFAGARLFQDMAVFGVKPTAVVYDALVQLFIAQGAIIEAASKLEEMVGCGFAPNPKTIEGMAVLFVLFCRFVEPDLISGCFPICTSYLRNNQIDTALSLLNRARMMFQLTMSRSMFQVLLQTLASKRRIRDLAEQFDRMVNRVRITPTQETVEALVKTYGDMHLFGRLGRLLAYLASRPDYKPSEEMQPNILRSLVAEGSLNSAEQLYTQLMTSCSEQARAPIATAFAQALFESGHINKAAEALKPVFPISPSSPVAQAANILKLKLALITAMESEANNEIGKKLMQSFEEQVANDVFVGNTTMDAQLYAALIDGWRLAGDPAAALATIAKALRVTNNEGFHRSDYINACMTLYNSIGKYDESVKLWRNCVARGHYAPSLQVCLSYIESARCMDPQRLLEVADFLDERGYTTELTLWKVLIRAFAESNVVLPGAEEQLLESLRSHAIRGYVDPSFARTLTSRLATSAFLPSSFRGYSPLSSSILSIPILTENPLSQHSKQTQGRPLYPVNHEPTLTEADFDLGITPKQTFEK